MRKPFNHKNRKKNFQSHRNGEGTLEEKEKKQNFQVGTTLQKNFTRCGSPLREKNIYKSHREDKIVPNECFQGPSLEKI